MVLIAKQKGAALLVTPMEVAKNDLDNAKAKREKAIKIVNNREGQYILYPRKVSINQDWWN